MGITNGFGWPSGRNPGGSRSAAGCLIALAAVLSSVLSVSMAQEMQQTVEEVHVTTGQQLADAVAEWGATGSNMTIFIDVPYISMRNVTFTNYSTIIARSRIRPFSQGLLTIKGKPNVNDPAKPTTILDAAMRSYLVPVPLTYPARYKISSLALVNQCELQLPLLAGRVNPPSPFFYALLGPLTFSYQSQEQLNIASYGRQAALALQVFQASLQATKIPALKSLVSQEILQPSDIPVEPMDEFTRYSAGVKSYTWSVGVFTNLTLKSIANPDDPVLMMLKSEGHFMPPQFCNGSRIPQPLVDAEIDPDNAPLRLVSTQQEFLKVLTQTADQTVIQPTIKGPPGAMALSMGRYTAPSTGSYQLSGPMLISGSNGYSKPTYAMYAWIDWQQRSNMFVLAPGTQLMMQWTVTSGYASRVPTITPAGLAPDDLVPSMFPLAIVNTPAGSDTWANFSSVVLSNLTMIIPSDDYLALIILAAQQAGRDLVACADSSVQQRVAQLQAGFHRIQTRPTATPEQLTVFEQLEGWGLTASNARIQPDAPVQLPACTSSTSNSSSSSVSRQAVIGMAVGIACGCALLLALILSAWLWHKKRKYQRTESKRSDQSALEATKMRDAALSGANSPQCASTVTIVTNPADSSAFNSSSTLTFGVQQARQDHQRLLDSVVKMSGAATSAHESGRNTADPARAVSPDEMHDQIQQLADQLSPPGDNQLLLAGILGKGSGGVVYIGLWKGMNVAVKTLVYHEDFNPSTTATGPQAPQPRAFMEAAIAASVGHPNLVATFHYDIKALAPAHEPGQPGGLQVDNTLSSTLRVEAPTYKVFLIQELCDLSLAAAIDRGLYRYSETEGLDVVAIVATLLDVAQGLAYLHSKGIIHGDLKPENIMLKVAPTAIEGVIAKLTDFGLSTKLTPGATHVSNYNYGSPFYVAPEVVHQHQMSPASDVYSLGIVMWQLIAQTAPYVFGNDGVFKPNPLFPSFPVHRTPPPAYQDLFLRCCAASPPLRPPIQEVVDSLRKLALRAQ